MPAEPRSYATPEQILQWSTQLVAANIERPTPAQLMRMADAVCDGIFTNEGCLEMAELVQYQGFDPAQTAGELWAQKKAKEVTDTAFKNDITMMCDITMTRATNLVSVKSRMNDEGKARVTELEQRYALKKGLTSTADIMLSRVALTFYQIRAARTVRTNAASDPC